MMKSQMEKLDIPPVKEFLGMIDAGGGEIYEKCGGLQTQIIFT